MKAYVRKYDGPFPDHVQEYVDDSPARALRDTYQVTVPQWRTKGLTGHYVQAGYRSLGQAQGACARLMAMGGGTNRLPTMAKTLEWVVDGDDMVAEFQPVTRG